MAKEECEQNYILIWQDTTPKTVQFVETNGKPDIVDRIIGNC